MLPAHNAEAAPRSLALWRRRRSPQPAARWCHVIAKRWRPVAEREAATCGVLAGLDGWRNGGDLGATLGGHVSDAATWGLERDKGRKWRVPARWPGDTSIPPGDRDRRRGAGDARSKSRQDSASSVRSPRSESSVLLKLSGQGCPVQEVGSFGGGMRHPCRRALRCKHNHASAPSSVFNQLLGA